VWLHEGFVREKRNTDSLPDIEVLAKRIWKKSAVFFSEISCSGRRVLEPLGRTKPQQVIPSLPFLDQEVDQFFPRYGKEVDYFTFTLHRPVGCDPVMCSDRFWVLGIVLFHAKITYAGATIFQEEISYTFQ